MVERRPASLGPRSCEILSLYCPGNNWDVENKTKQMFSIAVVVVVPQDGSDNKAHNHKGHLRHTADTLKIATNTE